MSAVPTSPTQAADARDLAVAWMNRGHALAVQNTRDSLAAALDAYDEAIARLETVVRGDGAADPSWSTSLGAALMNRGWLLHRLHGTAQSALALAALDEAATLLQALPEHAGPWPRRNLAGTWLNRATLLLDLGRLEDARNAAYRALALASPQERNDTVDADLALKSRRALCHALGRLVMAPGADHDAIAREASDLVDDGLALARFWTERGAGQPRELALRLFRFGARLYRIHQPHFLAEFLAEYVRTDDPDLVAIALDSIDAALGDRPREGEYLIAGTPETERRRQAWQDLMLLRTQLAPASDPA